MIADNICIARKDIVDRNQDVIIYKKEKCSYLVYDGNKYKVHSEAGGQYLCYSKTSFDACFTLILERKESLPTVPWKRTNTGSGHKWHNTKWTKNSGICLRCGLMRKSDTGRMIYSYSSLDDWFGGVPKCETRLEVEGSDMIMQVQELIKATPKPPKLTEAQRSVVKKLKEGWVLCKVYTPQMRVYIEHEDVSSERIRSTNHTLTGLLEIEVIAEVHRTGSVYKYKLTPSYLNSLKNNNIW